MFNIQMFDIIKCSNVRQKSQTDFFIEKGFLSESAILKKKLPVLKGSLREKQQLSSRKTLSQNSVQFYKIVPVQLEKSESVVAHSFQNLVWKEPIVLLGSEDEMPGNYGFNKNISIDDNDGKHFHFVDSVEKQVRKFEASDKEVFNETTKSEENKVSKIDQVQKIFDVVQQELQEARQQQHYRGQEQQQREASNSLHFPSQDHLIYKDSSFVSKSRFHKENNSGSDRLPEFRFDRNKRLVVGRGPEQTRFSCQNVEPKLTLELEGNNNKLKKTEIRDHDYTSR